MQIIEGAGQYRQPAGGEQTDWAEQFRVPDLSVGTYSIRQGGTDGQSPHTEDEIYVVTKGRARLQAGGQAAEASPGPGIYGPAAEPHRFTDISEDFAALVIFAPAEESRATGPDPA